jgi:tetratricopeptide (TPR) repeat protein
MVERQEQMVEVHVDRRRDPLEQLLLLAILGVIVLALIGAVYLLVTRVVNPPAPRTALEAQLVAVREATITNPYSGEVWADYITALIAVEDYREAGSVLDEAMAVLEGDALLLVEISGVDLFLAQERYEDAFELAEKAVVLVEELRDEVIRDAMARGIHADPKLYGPDITTDVYLNHARAAAGLEKWAVVVESLSTAIEYTPRAADLFYLRGDAYTHLDQIDKAIADFNSALMFDPEFDAARAALEKVGER